MNKKVFFKAVIILLGILMLADIYMALVWVPPIKVESLTERIAQRIFYFHVPSAWLGFLAFFFVFLGSIMYLWKKVRKYELLSAASAEIGVLFITIVLITGPIWAKPVWGVWWTWDTRLTSSLVLWLIYVAYIFLRRSLPDGKKRANLSSVVGIIGFFDVPIVYFSIRWWETQHPQAVMANGSGGMSGVMLGTFLFSLFVFTLFFSVLLTLRYKQMV